MPQLSLTPVHITRFFTVILSCAILPIVSSEDVYWNPGSNMIRHNTEFAEAKLQMATQGINLRRVECPPSLEDEILYIKNRYAKPDAARTLDIFRIEASWIHSIEDSLMDLSSFFTADELKEFDPKFLQAGYAHGKLLSIPSFMDYNLLYYRRDLLHKYGYHEPPQTWDEMEAMAVKIQEGERQHLCPGETCFWGLMWQGQANEYLTVITMSIIASHGGGGIVNSKGEVDIDNPNAVAALERMRKWIGWITPAVVINEDLQLTKLDFLLERAAFMIDLTHIIGEIHTWKPDGCIEPFNVFKCQEHSFGNRSSYTRIPGNLSGNQSSTNPWFWGWSVNKYTKSLEATKKVLKYLASYQQQVFKARNGDYSTLLNAQEYVEKELCATLPDPDICTVDAQSLNFITHKKELINEAYFDLGARPDHYGYSNLIFEAVNTYLLGAEDSAVPTIKNLSCKLTFRLSNTLDKCAPCPAGHHRTRQHPDADCVQDSVLKPWMIGVLCAGVVVLIALSTLVTYKMTYSDAFWTIRKDELVFDSPPLVLGKGSYGVVIRASFRGSYVAVKRVLPSSQTAKKASVSTGMFSMQDPAVLEAIRVQGSGSTQNGVLRSHSGTKSGSLGRGTDQRGRTNGETSASTVPDVNFSGRGDNSQGRPAEAPARNGSGGSDVEVSIRGDKSIQMRSGSNSNSLDVLGGENQGSGSRTTSFLSFLFSGKTRMASRSRMYNNFIKEMRVISRLRHPCITTVNGAVKEKKEPLLVMELMENGSLYELLRNETVELQGDLILPMLCDVTQGIHFLHAANPPIIHGDIKVLYLLVLLCRAPLLLLLCYRPCFRPALSALSLPSSLPTVTSCSPSSSLTTCWSTLASEPRSRTSG